jgi:CRP/FNR family transcriptional regulator, anaerobic regulatory protein
VAGYPQHRLSEFIELVPEEHELLIQAQGKERQVGRGGVIRSQGDPVREVFLLSQGWALGCVDLRDGKRQIVKIHLPGDMLGSPSMALTHAAETLLALTPVTVTSVPLSALGRIFTAAPRLAAALFLSVQQERIFLIDRLTAVGRLPAAARLAALIVHLHDRLALTGEVSETAIDWPLTQEQIGDVLGLTPVHINRTLGELERMGLVGRAGPQLELPSLERLRDFAKMPERQWVRNPDWFPAPPAN